MHKNHRDGKGNPSGHFAPGFAQKDSDPAELEALEDVTFSKKVKTLKIDENS